MKICTSEYQQEDIRKLTDELRFHISHLNAALVYAMDHPDKRVIVEIPSLKDEHNPTLQRLRELREENTNLFYDFFTLSDLATYAKSVQKDGSYMYHYPANTWGLIQILEFYNVADISAGEPLTFDLIKLSARVHKQGKRLRVCPHVARPTVAEEVGDGVVHFFITPDQTEFFEPYVDVLDILDGNIVREGELVKAYVKAENVHMPAYVVIQGLGVNLPSSVFTPNDFYAKRLYCRQTCLAEGRCHYCKQFVDTLDTLKASLQEAT